MQNGATREPLEDGDEWNKFRKCYVCDTKENLILLTIKDGENLKQYCLCKECDNLATFLSLQHL